MRIFTQCDALRLLLEPAILLPWHFGCPSHHHEHNPLTNKHWVLASMYRGRSLSYWCVPQTHKSIPIMPCLCEKIHCCFLMLQIGLCLYHYMNMLLWKNKNNMYVTPVKCCFWKFFCELLGYTGTSARFVVTCGRRWGSMTAQDQAIFKSKGQTCKWLPFQIDIVLLCVLLLVLVCAIVLHANLFCSALLCVYCVPMRISAISVDLK